MVVVVGLTDMLPAADKPVPTPLSIATLVALEIAQAKFAELHVVVIELGVAESILIVGGFGSVGGG